MWCFHLETPHLLMGVCVSRERENELLERKKIQMALDAWYQMNLPMCQLPHLVQYYLCFNIVWTCEEITKHMHCILNTLHKENLDEKDPLAFKDPPSTLSKIAVWLKSEISQNSNRKFIVTTLLHLIEMIHQGDGFGDVSIRLKSILLELVEKYNDRVTSLYLATWESKTNIQMDQEKVQEGQEGQEGLKDSPFSSVPSSRSPSRPPSVSGREGSMFIPRQMSLSSLLAQEEKKFNHKTLTSQSAPCSKRPSVCLTKD